MTWSTSTLRAILLKGMPKVNIKGYLCHYIHKCINFSNKEDKWENCDIALEKGDCHFPLLKNKNIEESECRFPLKEYKNKFYESVRRFPIKKKFPIIMFSDTCIRLINLDFFEN